MTAPLERRVTLLPATALNMSNMIGIGPFITIPLLMTGLGGPQALRVGGGARHRHRRRADLERARRGHAGIGRHVSVPARRLRPADGRLMAFLFIWQFILSGPLEIASGYIGFAQLRAVCLAGDGVARVAMAIAVTGPSASTSHCCTGESTQSAA